MVEGTHYATVYFTFWYLCCNYLEIRWQLQVMAFFTPQNEPKRIKWKTKRFPGVVKLWVKWIWAVKTGLKNFKKRKNWILHNREWENAYLVIKSSSAGKFVFLSFFPCYCHNLQCFILVREIWIPSFPKNAEIAWLRKTF